MPSSSQEPPTSSASANLSVHNTTCILLANMDGPLHEIVKGRVIPFLDGMRMMHGKHVPPHLTRVEVIEVREGFQAWTLHEIPKGSESPKTIGENIGWPLTWPTNELRLMHAPTISS